MKQQDTRVMRLDDIRDEAQCAQFVVLGSSTMAASASIDCYAILGTVSLWHLVISPFVIRYFVVIYQFYT